MPTKPTRCRAFALIVFRTDPCLRRTIAPCQIICALELVPFSSSPSYRSVGGRFSVNRRFGAHCELRSRMFGHPVHSRLTVGCSCPIISTASGPCRKVMAIFPDAGCRSSDRCRDSARRSRVVRGRARCRRRSIESRRSGNGVSGNTRSETMSISSDTSITSITTPCGTGMWREQWIGRIQRFIGTCAKACIRSIGVAGDIKSWASSSEAAMAAHGGHGVPTLRDPSRVRSGLRTAARRPIRPLAPCLAHHAAPPCNSPPTSTAECPTPAIP